MTQEVWNEIAGNWYGFRHHTIFRTELTALAKRWQKGRLLNIGCGHGPDFLPFIRSTPKEYLDVILKPSFDKIGRNGEESSNLLHIRDGGGDNFHNVPQNVVDFELCGIDFSVEMLRLARKYGKKFNFNPHLALADARLLPFRDESFSWVIAVASLHHIENREGRLEALAELKRVLKPGGEAFITVWNRRQPRFWFKRSDTLVDWKQQGKIIERYYHLFSYSEVVKMVRQAGLEIIKSFPESSYRFPIKIFSRNICILLRKNG
jgi:ubiquinone/menaquinone biosynthesis C-methylase UbiE